MSSDHSTPQSSTQSINRDLAVPDAVIEDFLGLGLAYSEWPTEVKKRGYVWYPALENIIIEKEWEYFKPEIQNLRLEPRIAQSSRSKSNSLVSILKRLKGEPWVEGRPDEREERRHTRRLLGKDAKIRCLQKYVSDWDKKAALSVAQCSLQNVADRSAPDCTTEPGTASTCPATGIGSPLCPPEAQGVCETPEVESGHTLRDTDMTIYPDQSLMTTSDFELLPSFQNALPHPHAQISPYYLESDAAEMPTQSTPASSHDTTMAPLDKFEIVGDHVPHSASNSQILDLSEGESNYLTSIETNPVSEETLKSSNTATHYLGPAFRGTFFDSSDTVDMSEYFIFDEVSALEAGLTQEATGRDFVGQPSLQQGYAEDLFPSVSSPQHRSHARKRRRQDTSRVSSDTSRYTNATLPPSNPASDGDTLMVDYESSSHQNSPVLQEQQTQLAPTRTIPIPASSGMTSKVTCTSNFTQIRLELELQRIIEESQSATKRHQQELDSLRQRHQAEISTLQEQVRELQESTEYYEGLAREFLSQNVVLQEASSRKKSVSELSPTRTKEREHSVKPGHSFPSSKTPRPLSLSLRPATAGNSSSSSHKSSAATFQDTSGSKLPTATSSSSRPSSADSTTLKVTAVYDTPGPRSNSLVSSEIHAPALSSSKPAGRGTRSGPVDNVAAADVNHITKRDPNPIQQSMHKFSNWILRKPYREESSRPIEPAPTLPPPVTASVPLHREMSGVLIDGDKRRTKDSGYASLQSETNSRKSMADAE